MCKSDEESRIIIPAEVAIKIVSQTNNIYLRECPCRVSAGNCPPDTREVCLLFEGGSENDGFRGRPISRLDAASLVQKMAESRMIHNLFYRTATGQPLELCNCCTCCCEPLHDLKEKGDYDQQLRTSYMAFTDELLCTGCGECLDSCYFEARRLVDGSIKWVDERCFGCGRCVGACPEKAIHLAVQPGRGLVGALNYG